MKRLVYWLRELLFPRKCMLCRCALGKDEMDLCCACRTQTPEYPFGAANPAPDGKNKLHFLDSFTAVWYYEGDVRRSLLRYKFRRGIYLAPRYGRLLAMRLLTQGPEQFDVLTWVPVSRLRRLRRGYDQCELLARAVGEELEIEPKQVLRKVRHTPPQSGQLSSAARKANVLGAYALVPGMDVAGKTVVLLDDIRTTGATLEECARVLLTAGAKEVHAAAVAAGRNYKK